MEPQRQGQAQSGGLPAPMIGRRDLITPNPKLKLLDQVREVMRLKHYSIRTETAYCDWIRRYIKFHAMRSREDLQPAEAKMELFLQVALWQRFALDGGAAFAGAGRGFRQEAIDGAGWERRERSLHDVAREGHSSPPGALGAGAATASKGPG